RAPRLRVSSWPATDENGTSDRHPGRGRPRTGGRSPSPPPHARTRRWRRRRFRTPSAERSRRPAWRSAYLDELLEATKPGRGRLVLVAIAPVGEGDLADIDVAARIDRQAVRRHELTRLDAGRANAQPRQHLTLVAVDADPRSDVRHVVIDAHAAADLANVEAALGPAFHVEPRRPVHVVPLRLEPAVALENLSAMVLAVGHVHPAVGVAADVVRNV